MLHRKNKAVSKHIKEKQRSRDKAGKDRKPAPSSKKYNWPIIAVVLVFVFAIIGVMVGLNLSKSSQQLPGSSDTPPASTSTPPAIYNIQVSRITSDSMKVVWETDRACKGVIMYTQENTNNTFASWPEEKNTNKHSIDLVGLSPATTYQLQIKCTDEKGTSNIYKVTQTYTTAGVPQALGLKIGDTVKDFELFSTKGERFKLSDFKEKYVVLVFWQHACKACREEMPLLREYFNRIPASNFILAINDGEDEAVISAFAKSEKLTFPVLLDPDRKVTESYTIATFPTILLVHDMKVIKLKEGSFKSVEEIEEFARPSQ